MLKILGIAGRGVFLFLVAPELLDGELAHYVFLMTIASLIGRVFCFGLDEHLPMTVRGDKEVAAPYFRLVEYLVVVEVLLAMIVVIIGVNDFTVTALLAICYVATPILGATLKTIRVTGSERLRDLHWVFFGCLIIAPLPWQGTELLATMCVSMMAVQLLELTLSKSFRMRRSSSFISVRADLRKQMSESWPKILAMANIVAIVRAVILWPRLFRLNVPLDELAYFLLLGEAFWQIAMVIVHRKYAGYCVLASNSVNEVRSDMNRTMLVLFGFVVLVSGTSITAGFFDIRIDAIPDWRILALFIAFFGLLTSYMLVRYAIWSLKAYDWRLTFWEVTFFVVQGLICLLRSPDTWILSITIVALFATIIAWAYGNKTLSYLEGVK